MNAGNTFQLNDLEITRNRLTARRATNLNQSKLNLSCPSKLSSEISSCPDILSPGRNSTVKRRKNQLGTLHI